MDNCDTRLVSIHEVLVAAQKEKIHKVEEENLKEEKELQPDTEHQGHNEESPLEESIEIGISLLEELIEDHMPPMEEINGDEDVLSLEEPIQLVADIEIHILRSCHVAYLLWAMI